MERSPLINSPYNLTPKNELTDDIDVYQLLKNTWEEGWKIVTIQGIEYHNYDMYYFGRRDLFLTYYTLYLTTYNELPLLINHPQPIPSIVAKRLEWNK